MSSFALGAGPGRGQPARIEQSGGMRQGVGEWVWLDSRPAARDRKGAGFDLKEFHRFALGLGGMGLGQLTRELARY
jgi:Bacterial protein of unknown function (DUF885)